jgi:hypothetical protein
MTVDGTVYQNINYTFYPVGNVLGYENNTAFYGTSQNYEYDGLYQLTKVMGKSQGSGGDYLITWETTNRPLPLIR